MYYQNIVYILILSDSGDDRVTNNELNFYIIWDDKRRLINWVIKKRWTKGAKYQQCAEQEK
jgi:hypothetical protein